MTSATFATNASIRAPSERVTYPHKRAVVVGVDRDAQGRMPALQYAASDAQSVAQVLLQHGFDVTLLINRSATKAAITQAVRDTVGKTETDDLILVYYSGSTFRSNDVARATGPGALVLPTSDVDLDQPLSNVILPELVRQLEESTKGDKLIILDGCHGTYGLETSLLRSSPSISHRLNRFRLFLGRRMISMGSNWQRPKEERLHKLY